MTKRWAMAAVLLAAGVVGCGSGSPSGTRPSENKTDIHIGGPKGGGVDIHTKSDGGGASVNVERKGTGK